jgi:cbb3-type cytochrome oxidase subunit 3
MNAQVLSHFQYPLLTAIGMLIFIAIFLVALVRVLNPGNRSMYRYIQSIPLNEEKDA